MNKSLYPIATLFCITSAYLVGCSSQPTCDYVNAPYMNAKEEPSLQVPEGLSAPDHSGALVIPPANEKLSKPAAGKKSRCLDRPPSYFATGAIPKEPKSTESKPTKSKPTKPQPTN
jgi:uncharacterized lipoprotein